MRRLRPVQKRKPGEFRLLRHIGVGSGRTREEALAHATEVNVSRFRKHVARLKHRLRADLALRKIKLQARRRSRAERLSRSFT